MIVITELGLKFVSILLNQSETMIPLHVGSNTEGSFSSPSDDTYLLCTTYPGVQRVRVTLHFLAWIASHAHFFLMIECLKLEWRLKFNYVEWCLIKLGWPLEWCYNNLPFCWIHKVIAMSRNNNLNVFWKCYKGDFINSKLNLTSSGSLSRWYKKYREGPTTKGAIKSIYSGWPPVSALKSKICPRSAGFSYYSSPYHSFQFTRWKMFICWCNRQTLWW